MPTDTHQEQVELVAETPEALHDQAVERLKKRAEFKTHAVVYALVNLVIWGIWIIISIGSGSWWPWPMIITLAWGIGLVMNAWDVYARKPISEEDVQREMDRLRGMG